MVEMVIFLPSEFLLSHSLFRIRSFHLCLSFPLLLPAERAPTRICLDLSEQELLEYFRRDLRDHPIQKSLERELPCLICTPIFPVLAAVCQRCILQIEPKTSLRSSSLQCSYTE